ncbi:MAG TPA: IS91 family transposase [Acidobacteriota bacterium]|nr:IS91 family transposase [Acidobacteriota bacterium]
MKRRRLETADVLRSCETGLQALPPQQRKAFRDITACRTAALGGWVRRCGRCGHQQISYRSCRNRHCPKCQAGRSAEWVQARGADLLPVPYYHVVFTLPEPLGPIALQNQRAVYGILFAAASQTLRTIAADEKHLGARIGFAAVLHTWGQTLTHHPHIHCVVAGGGLSADHSRWVRCREDFFLPVQVLSRFFRRRFLELLDQARRKGELVFAGKLQALPQPARWAKLLARLREIEWNVYCKPPFGGPGQVLKYLARYTHRVAISNSRLISLKDGRVTFRYKDYRRGRLPRTMTLEAAEFTRRFLQHVLPKGFVRIRSFGFLANCCRREKLALCRRLLGCEPQEQAPERAPCGGETPPQEPPSQPCPNCRLGTMLLSETLAPEAFALSEARSRSP